MRVFLKNISKQLKQFSKSLDKKSILIDQPWALIDEEFEMQKLIFKKDGELIMSKNGKVSVGNWEYLNVSKSLLIDRGEDKILCREVYIDEGVLILKLDGTDSNFMVLANENHIPDLNIKDYLTKKIDRSRKNYYGDKNKISGKAFGLNKFELRDGTTVFIDLKQNTVNYRKGDVVYKDPEGKKKLSDGYYKLSFMEGFRIRNGEIV